MTSSTEQPTDTSSLRSFPGWRVVAGCLFVLLINAGLAFSGLSVYLNACSKEQDWPLSSISFAVTILFIAGAVIAGGSLALVGQVTSQWQLYVAYAVFVIG